MPINFDSPKSLIRHAREDLIDFQTICKKAVANDGSTYVNIVDIDPQTGKKTYKIKFVGSIPSRARYTANNIINNLRHSLDQAAVASIEAITGSRAADIYFPFATSPTDLTGRLQKFPVDLHPIFNSFQPYPSGVGYVGGNDFLCAVTKVVGPNKHQITLSPCLDAAPELQINAMQVSNASIPVPQWDAAKGEMIIGIAEPDGEIQYDVGIKFHIAFGDAGPMFRQPIIPVLHEFAAIADRIVLNLEAETKRLLVIP